CLALSSSVVAAQHRTVAWFGTVRGHHGCPRVGSCRRPRAGSPNSTAYGPESPHIHSFVHSVTRVLSRLLRGSPVGVPGAASPDRAGAAGPARTARPADDDLRDGLLADLLGKAPFELRLEQPELGGPGGGVGADDEYGVVEGLDDAVVGELVADDLAPPSDDAAHAHRRAPAALREEPVDDRAEGLRVAARRSCPTAHIPEARPGAEARARAWRAASAGSSVPSAPAPSAPPGSGRFFWGSVGRSATGDLPSGDGEPGSGELGRHVVRDGGGDEDLLGARDHGGQSL